MSQVVLTGTINYAKNLKPIVAKILIQICAKIGGLPWAIETMPFLDKRTMLCGLTVFHEKVNGPISIMGLIASYNKTGTKYWSTTRQM